MIVALKQANVNRHYAKKGLRM